MRLPDSQKRHKVVLVPHECIFYLSTFTTENDDISFFSLKLCLPFTTLTPSTLWSHLAPTSVPNGRRLSEFVASHHHSMQPSILTQTLRTGAARRLPMTGRRYASGHGPHYNEPSGWLFGEKVRPYSNTCLVI